MIAKNLMFSDAQAITTTANATDDIDMGPGRDAFGTSKPNEASDLWLIVRVNTTFAGGTSIATKLQDSADGSSWTDFTGPPTLVGGAIAAASLTQGYFCWKVRLPKGVRRYMRLVYTVVGTFTSGKMDAYLTDSLEQLT